VSSTLTPQTSNRPVSVPCCCCSLLLPTQIGRSIDSIEAPRAPNGPPPRSASQAVDQISTPHTLGAVRCARPTFLTAVRGHRPPRGALTLSKFGEFRRGRNPLRFNLRGGKEGEEEGGGEWVGMGPRFVLFFFFVFRHGWTAHHPEVDRSIAFLWFGCAHPPSQPTTQNHPHAHTPTHTHTHRPALPVPSLPIQNHNHQPPPHPFFSPLSPPLLPRLAQHASRQSTINAWKRPSPPAAGP
jgi:hypothetical protein